MPKIKVLVLRNLHYNVIMREFFRQLGNRFKENVKLDVLTPIRYEGC